MRELDEEEQAALDAINAETPTAVLRGMAADLVEILRGRGLVIQARVVEVMATRLAD